MKETVHHPNRPAYKKMMRNATKITVKKKRRKEKIVFSDRSLIYIPNDQLIITRNLCQNNTATPLAASRSRNNKCLKVKERSSKFLLTSLL